MSSHLGFRLAENATPMRLCLLCSKLNIDVLLEHSNTNPLEHQPCFTALETSALSGCEMCSLFLEGILTDHCGRLEISRNDALQEFRATESERSVPSPWLLKPTIVANYVDDFCQLEHFEYGVIKSSFSAYFRVRNCRARIKSLRRSFLRYLTGTLPGDGFGNVPTLIKGVRLPATTAKRAKMDSKPPQLPTRVVDFGLSQGEEPRLIESRSRNAEYVTLSHCWGNVQPLKTVLSNLEQHLNCIPLDSMPQTFQDAVIATRKLGFRYLWIDSLCIVQDSSQDWELECSKMTSIYRNSSLTICGSMASNSASGFLNSRTYPEPGPYLWEYKNTKEVDYKRATINHWLEDHGHYESADYPDRDDETDEEGKSPLRRRGWILQEYLLSSRLLFFGLYRMHWERTICVQFEDFQLRDDSREEQYQWSIISPRRGLHSLIVKSSISTVEMASPTDLSQSWYSIIQDYTQRFLSEPSDKLPAIYGIAKWLFRGREEDYVVGFPKNTLHEGLAWTIYPVGRDAPQLPSTRPHGTWSWCLDQSNYPANIQKHSLPAYRAPSWFWASTDYPVYFGAIRKDNGWDWMDERTEAEQKAYRTRVSTMSEQNKMLIQSISIKLHDDDPFGRVKSGSIKLKGRVKTGIVVRVPNNMAESSWLYVMDPILGGPTGLFYPDDPPWDLYVKTATEIRDDPDQPGIQRECRVSEASTSDDVGAAEKTKQERSSFLDLP